jgi:hypothetical protein
LHFGTWRSILQLTSRRFGAQAGLHGGIVV